jgi:hypothetical protein
MDQFCTYTSFMIISRLRGRVSSVGIATPYGLDGPGIESRWGGEIFPTRPDRPWCPPSLLYNGYRVSFPGGKRPGRGVGYRPPCSAEVKERVELYLFSRSGPSWPVLGRTSLCTVLWHVARLGDNNYSKSSVRKTLREETCLGL